MTTPNLNKSITPQIVRGVAEAEDDFGHEMRVGRMLKALCVRYEHGGTYTDRVTGKPRQFDFRASFVKRNMRIHLAVEAKNLAPKNPLVLCGTKRRKEESFYSLIERGGDGRGANGPAIRAYRGHDVYPWDGFVVKNAFRVTHKQQTGWTKSNDADVYERWTQALGSAVDLCLMSIDEFSMVKISTAVIPILVVSDDSLWQVEYDDDGKFVRDPAPVESCTYFVDHTVELTSTLNFTFSHLHFFTLTGFAEWIRGFCPPHRPIFDNWFDDPQPLNMI